MSNNRLKIPVANHVGLAQKLKNKKDYTNYRSAGGTLSFPEWKKQQK